MSHIKSIITVIKGLVEHIREDLQQRWQNRNQKISEHVKELADLNIENLQNTSRLSHWILWSSFSFFLIMGIWAKFAILDEVTRGEGVVIPSSQIQLIQNLEGGIVKQLLVKEGDVVEKGQILIKLDNARFSSSYQEDLMKEISLNLKIARLEAELSNKDMVIQPDIQAKFPDRVQQARLEFETQMNEIKKLQEDYDLALNQLNMLRPLLKSGAASHVEVIQQEQTVNQMKGNLLKQKSTSFDELNTAKADLAALNAGNVADKDRLSRTIIRSPVHGIIKKINFNTIGGVIGAGSDIMEIVPLDDTLLIEAKIKPQDIGFIHPLQNTLVKITAYDFSIYGGLAGTVENISADTIKNEKDEAYYLIKVRTKKNFLKKNDQQLPIIPGMHASVDIITGKKSVLDYLLKPILKAKQNAMRER